MTISEFIREYQRLTHTEVITFLQEHQEEHLHSGVLGRAFEKLYIDQHIGWTDRDIPISELCSLHKDFNISNGASWSRRDDGAYLGKKYIIVNNKENGHIVSVCANGIKSYDDRPTFKKISIEIIRELEDAADTYKCLKAALSSDAYELDADTINDINDTIDKAEIKMLHIIDDITKTQNN